MLLLHNKSQTGNVRSTGSDFSHELMLGNFNNWWSVLDISSSFSDILDSNITNWNIFGMFCLSCKNHGIHQSEHGGKYHIVLLIQYCFKNINTSMFISIDVYVWISSISFGLYFRYIWRVLYNSKLLRILYSPNVYKYI